MDWHTGGIDVGRFSFIRYGCVYHRGRIVRMCGVIPEMFKMLKVCENVSLKLTE